MPCRACRMSSSCWPRTWMVCTRVHPVRAPRVFVAASPAGAASTCRIAASTHQLEQPHSLLHEGVVLAQALERGEPVGKLPLQLGHAGLCAGAAFAPAAHAVGRRLLLRLRLLLRCWWCWCWCWHWLLLWRHH